MKRVVHFFLLPLLAALLFESCISSRGASGLPADSESMALIRVGKRYMENDNYGEAVKVLKDATARPINQYTTMSTYLLGLSQLKNGNAEEAMRTFQNFESRFPKSKYLDEVSYHYALSQLQSNNYLIQEKGLDRLWNLSKEAGSSELGKQASDQAKNFLFYTMDPEKIERYADHVSAPYDKYVFEAQVFRLVKSNRLVEAKNFYDSLKSSRRTSSEFLDNLLNESRLERVQKNTILKIALFLPFNLSYSSVSFIDEIPEQSRLALDFYEGFLTALENYENSTGKKVFVKVFDTREDTFTVQTQLMELDALNPQGIIGGYQREVVEQLGEWAEMRQVPYFIPFSPFAYLAEDKAYSFLMSPSVEMHGRRMAEHAYWQLGLRKVAVWSNQQQIANQMASGFDSVFTALGGEIQSFLIDSVFDEGAEEEIPSYVMEMKRGFFDGVYIPINNDEESANLILSLISKEEIELIALGSPRWKNYTYISKDLKENFQLHISTTNMYSTEEPAYRDFYNTYLKNYYYPPSDRSLQGYNMGRYYMYLYENFGYDMPFTDYVKGASFVPGIQQSFLFGGGHINQYVNIAKFADGILMKENKNEFYSQQVPQLPKN